MKKTWKFVGSDWREVLLMLLSSHIQLCNVCKNGGLMLNRSELCKFNKFHHFEESLRSSWIFIVLTIIIA